MTTVQAIIALLQHCSDAELIEVAKCARTMAGPEFVAWWEQPYGKTTEHDTREADPLTAVPWRPGVLPGDFGPEGTHVPTGGQLPPSKLDETINRGRFK